MLTLNRFSKKVILPNLNIAMISKIVQEFSQTTINKNRVGKYSCVDVLTETPYYNKINIFRLYVM